MFFQSDKNNLYAQQFIMFSLILLFRSTTDTSSTVAFAHVLHTSLHLLSLGSTANRPGMVADSE